MTDPILLAALLLASSGATALCGALISRRVHDRRVQARLQESMHLYAVARAFFAERRSPV
ncbi:MAG TPA: hypothetical protein VEW45_06415 [Candidatus Dormibacteraeota bacterium]|nr:hypothetical protein [Candidatus Dormibacteraeota bacterium]